MTTRATTPEEAYAEGGSDGYQGHETRVDDYAGVLFDAYEAGYQKGRDESLDLTFGFGR